MRNVAAQPMRRVVIAGGGIAGVTAAETLRRHGFAGELTLVSDERHSAYSRPALSKAALVDVGDMTSHRLPEADHGAEELQGRVTGLDRDRSRLQLADGEDLPFDGLIIATGSRARRVSRASAELTLRSLDDAEELRRRLTDQPDVVVVGSGPLAMEVASGCRASGCQVTLIARHRPMSTQLGSYLSDVLIDEALAAGVRLRYSSDVTITDIPDGGRVQVSDGEVFEAPLIVSAVGDEPNVEWLHTSGALTGGALRTDRRGRVLGADGRPGARTVAVGDVATIPWQGVHRRIPLWTSAIEQAKVAAEALLKGDEAPELSFQPYFWTEQFGVSVKICGDVPLNGAPEIIDGSLAERSALLRWPLADGTAVAASVGYRIPIPRLRALTRPARV